MSDEQEIVERLEAIMKGFGWNQAQLAKQFGVQRNNVNKWLSGSLGVSGPVVRLMEIHEAWLESMQKDGVTIKFLRD